MEKKANFVCSRSTVDGIYPPLILAIQARRLGADSMIFFTFDGINAVRKGCNENMKYFPPGFLGVVPGVPSAAAKTMIKMAEKKANVPCPSDLLEMASCEGVRFYACKMTMDMMGLSKEDLLTGVEVTDAHNFMQRALDSEVNMFI